MFKPVEASQEGVILCGNVWVGWPGLHTWVRSAPYCNVACEGEAGVGQTSYPV